MRSCHVYLCSTAPLLLPSIYLPGVSSAVKKFPSQHWTWLSAVCLLLSRPLPQSAPHEKQPRLVTHSDRLVALTGGLCQPQLSSEKAQTPASKVANHFFGLTVRFFLTRFLRPEQSDGAGSLIVRLRLDSGRILRSLTESLLCLHLSSQFRPSSFTCAKPTPARRVASGARHPTPPTANPD